ncbi:GNAT family N-acetyltransferase [Luteimonas sp. SX5]|uniref:GNAT family N-acetyltransferase n=1 Tax=Luteimonas galliterrae TaxID=2940486 RepID=A0ABT0MG52_9GAMM|nr:GNAT family N-acetyltransferase [Luteimonas galliterrae]MCL1633841.1 GNAT family N-acetyltransferase [Luteimonas galliterrae]
MARLWHEGWVDSHAPILPPALAKYRTLESFRSRLQSLMPQVRVIGEPGQPLGLCITRGDELYQLFVSAAARGTGVAVALLADGEARLRDRGVHATWLTCAIGNHRAARFYEKNGWVLAGNMIDELPTPDGAFPLEVWRFEKTLSQSA